MNLNDKTVYFLGKLAASNRKDATEIVRRYGGKVVRHLTPAVQVVVLGEGDVLTQDWNLWNDQLDDATREAFEAGTLEIVSEAFFWDSCGESQEPNADTSARPLYTPSMLAELTGVSVSMIRRLQRERFLVPVKQIHRLSYFDFENVLPLKIVRNMLDAGASYSKAVSCSQHIKRHFSDGWVDVRLKGKDFLFVTKKGLVDQVGQRRFDFILNAEESVKPTADADEDRVCDGRLGGVLDAALDSVFEPDSEYDVFSEVEKFCEAAWTLETEGDLLGAVDVYRTASAAKGPTPQLNFQIAELLYRLGDLTAARERYFMAIELDETFVEARANLGCVLAELGNDELAAAAFRGALKHHPDYAEVHFHLGMLLRRVGLEEDAQEHFRIFLELMPDSPWADRIAEKQ